LQQHNTKYMMPTAHWKGTRILTSSINWILKSVKLALLDQIKQMSTLWILAGNSCCDKKLVLPVISRLILAKHKSAWTENPGTAELLFGDILTIIILNCTNLVPLESYRRPLKLSTHKTANLFPNWRKSIIAERARGQKQYVKQEIPSSEYQGDTYLWCSCRRRHWTTGRMFLFLRRTRRRHCTFHKKLQFRRALMELMVQGCNLMEIPAEDPSFL
jgi:hypothetical protein